ncbi:MAG TPA: four helix bundle protein [Longimicrobiales bacterium]
METLDHERLEVYQLSIIAIAAAHEVLSTVPRGHANLSDQLYRAVMSIALNIAEGADEHRPLEKARFYRIARRSAAEASAALDVLACLGLTDRGAIQNAKVLLARIVAMLVRLAQAMDQPGRSTRRRTHTGRATAPRKAQQ